MKKLVTLYQDLLEVHYQLENLLKVAYFKLYRREDLINFDLTPDQLIKRHNEDEYDLMAYTNAINVKFQFYCNLMLKYLKLYLQNNFSSSLVKSKDIIKQAFKAQIITAQEYKKFTTLKRYIKQIAKPDAHGNYEYTDDIIEYYQLLNIMLLKINPEAEVFTASSKVDYQQL